MKLLINQNFYEPACPPGTVLLDLLRSEGLKGTKEGCREGDCGACTVLIGELGENGLTYKTAASCLLPVGDCNGKHVVTIEGLNQHELSPVQQAIVDEGATQCGFCTPGIVVALTGFLLTTKTFSLEDAFAAVEGNICRCTGYVSIKRACENLVAKINLENNKDRIQTLVTAGLLAEYFVHVAEKLQSIHAEKSNPAPTDIKIAGGTDLFVQQAHTLKNHALHFLSGDVDLGKIQQRKNEFLIGGAVTVEALKNHDAFKQTFPGMHKALNLVSSTLIRNRATLAGNIVNASPIGDITIMLLALDATLIIKQQNKARELSLDAFYQGYKKFDLHDNEIIADIRIPVPASASRFNFEKVSRREHLDIAGVNTAMLITAPQRKIEQARLSAGGVSPIPLYLNKTSAFLKGKSISIDTFRQCIEIMQAEISPIDDIRGSANYKRSMLRRLFAAHWLTFFPQLEEDLAHEFA